MGRVTNLVSIHIFATQKHQKKPCQFSGKNHLVSNLGSDRKRKNILAYAGTAGILWLELEPTVFIPTHLTMKSLNIPWGQLSVPNRYFLGK